MAKVDKAVQEITERLEQGVQNMFASDAYKEYLSFMAKFHNYSACNSLLIWMQKPDATLVAGYKAWQTKHKRQVRKGEKAIRIFAPCQRKFIKKELDENGNEVEKEIKYTTFRATSVFDISQTDGEEVPTISVEELDGSVTAFSELMGKLIQLAPVSVEISEIKGSAKGFFSPVEQRIVVKENMSEVQTIKTAIHEIAHAMLHDKGAEKEDADRREKEVQAESVAYTVCSYLGLDTSDYSFGYVTGWSSDKKTKELTASMEVIRKTACQIIEGIAA